MRPSLVQIWCLLCLVAGCSSEPATEALGSGGRQHALATPRVTSSDSGAPAEPGDEGIAPLAPQDCERSRFVLRPDVSNARDLGGVPLSPSGVVECGAIFRGPPLQLSQDGCEELSALGVRTVLDLRMEQESEATPEAACVTAKHVLAPLPVPYGLGPEDYLRDLNTDSSIALVFHTFGNPAAYPIYFHCTYGRDRTGVVGALALLVLGATRETVMTEYMLSQPNVGAYPDSLSAVLDEIESRGGAERFLLDLGITEAELAVMKSKVRAR